MFRFRKPADVRDPRQRWADPTQHGVMAGEALKAAGLEFLEPAVDI